MSQSLYQFSATDIKGQNVPLSNYQGKLVLVVNTASKCGLTPQYEGLEEMYKKYSKEGFTILGFPCNQFMNQEPGDESNIQSECLINYGVSFPMFSKIDVNGKNAHPLYKWMKKEKGGFLFSAIKWNFTKFLIDQNGQVVKRFGPNEKPEVIDAYLKKHYLHNA